MVFTTQRKNPEIDGLKVSYGYKRLYVWSNQKILQLNKLREMSLLVQGIFLELMEANVGVRFMPPTVAKIQLSNLFCCSGCTYNIGLGKHEAQVGRASHTMGNSIQFFHNKPPLLPRFHGCVVLDLSHTCDSEHGTNTSAKGNPIDQTERWVMTNRSQSITAPRSGMGQSCLYQKASISFIYSFVS